MVTLLAELSFTSSSVNCALAQLKGVGRHYGLQKIWMPEIQLSPVWFSFVGVLHGIVMKPWWLGGRAADNVHTSLFST